MSVPYITANVYFKLRNLANTDVCNYSTDLRQFLKSPASLVCKAEELTSLRHLITYITAQRGNLHHQES